MPTIAWFNRLAIVASPLLLTACASLGPPTGWVAKDPATSTGTFYYGDGGRYEGGYAGEQFQGHGTIFYEYSQAHQGYTDTSDAPQLRNGQLSGEFSNGHLVKARGVSYTTEWNNNATYTPPGAFTYKGGYDGGFKGQGKVVFKDGRRFKGTFGNEPTLFTVGAGNGVIFKESQLIGSYFEGPGSMRWKNGATFEGVAYRYYLFDRDRGMMNPDNLTCVSSQFYGKGVLKEPGKPDYVGLVTENDEQTAPEHASEERFVRYAERLAECPGTLAYARDRINGIQSQMDAEMAEGRANAQAMLAADLSNLANRVSYDAARVDAASRGSSYEIEQAKQQRSADYARFISEQDADTSSERSKRQAHAAQQQAQAAKKPAISSQASSKKATQVAAAEPASDDSSAASEQAANQANAERLEHDKAVKRSMDEIERKRAATAEAAKQKTEKEAQARQLEQAKKQYLAQLRDKTKLMARTCPGGEGKHYLVGLRPSIKPSVVECLDVHYSAACPGTRQNTQGVIKNFLGASTDCYLGDAAEIAPQLDCKASEVVVKVREVTECR